MDRFALGHEAWPILVDHAARHATLTYQELAVALGYSTARIARFALWSIQDFCLEKGYPPLTSIVVNKHTGVPGQGFKLGGATLGDAQTRAFSFNWGTVTSPFQPRSLVRLRAKASMLGTKDQPNFEVPDMESAANGRGPYQDRFRKLLLKVYGRRCALCDTRHRDLLVACHIVPWAQDSKNRLSPRNGILLCRTHDAAYEHGLIRIATDGTVNLVDLTTSMGSDLLAFLKRTRPRLPKVRGGCQPDARFLAWRFGKPRRHNPRLQLTGS
jgi:putative restriction endonuclease